MFIETNIPINLDQIDENQLINTCFFLQNLGWDGVVFNMHIGSHNIDKMDSYLTLFPLLVQKLSHRVSLGQNFNNNDNNSSSSSSEHLNIYFSSPLRIKNATRIRPTTTTTITSCVKFQIFSRLTFIENFKSFARLNFDEEKFRVIDLLSIVPTSVSQLRALVLKLNVDIIGLHYDLHNNISKNHLNDYSITSGVPLNDWISLGKSHREILTTGKRQIVQLMKRHVGLEICYGYAIQTEQVYSKFMHLFTSLIRLTKSQNIIMANGVHDQTVLRSPYDVSNLALMVGLDHSIGKHLITTHVREALMHAEQRCTLKGIVHLSIQDHGQSDASESSTTGAKKRPFNQMRNE